MSSLISVIQKPSYITRSCTAITQLFPGKFKFHDKKKVDAKKPPNRSLSSSKKFFLTAKTIMSMRSNRSEIINTNKNTAAADEIMMTETGMAHNASQDPMSESVNENEIKSLLDDIPDTTIIPDEDLIAFKTLGDYADEMDDRGKYSSYQEFVEGMETHAEPKDIEKSEFRTIYEKTGNYIQPSYSSDFQSFVESLYEDTAQPEEFQNSMEISTIKAATSLPSNMKSVDLGFNLLFSAPDGTGTSELHLTEAESRDLLRVTLLKALRVLNEADSNISANVIVKGKKN